MSESKDDSRYLSPDTTVRISRTAFNRILLLKGRLVTRARRGGIPTRGLAIGAVVDRALEALERELDRDDKKPPQGESSEKRARRKRGGHLAPPAEELRTTSEATREDDDVT